MKKSELLLIKHAVYWLTSFAKYSLLFPAKASINYTNSEDVLCRVIVPAFNLLKFKTEQMVYSVYKNEMIVEV